MIEEMKRWSDKLKDGLDLAHNFHYEHSGQLSKNIKKIVFVGMGGSGIAGRIVKTFLDKKTQLPSFIIDSPELPLFVDTDTLAIVISYSGNTWETVRVLEKLAEKFIPTIAMASGGKVAEISEKKNIPFIVLPESKSPRSALGNFLGIVLGLLDLMGIMPGKQILKDFDEYLKLYLPKFESDSTSFDEFVNIVGSRDMFHIFGVSGDSAAFAYRAQTQFNENSKIRAVASDLPESAHNLLVGFTDCKDKPLVVMFSTAFLSSEVEASFEIIGQLLTERGAEVYKLPVLGDTWESQLFHFILWSDFASYYLGKARGVQVESVEIIDELKKRFAQRKFK